ncbi:tripartite-type tricarboxylate transporter receptor subunit TctC [Azorhizobium sp. AG788]|uniref:Bug family tripartite tricarboxylate transporter substrate binding protein n=1 Tax=Azorhizobium sp. AG788 TaxID=2183897 RepID=UPI001061FAE8|nr:tripartite tricarboxylate transporter substrate binding protein [Azorhizobium sp. AG788]TDU00852.1 tripartite-type tricarboxylate transporter receptor subunit TctC [Azorhizobium sp. AG788]
MKHVLLGIIASALICTTGHAQTNYPQRPVKIVVGYAPGGATDVATRVVASEMTKILKQQVIVENRVGGSGTIGMDNVAKSKPDGYTLGMAGVGATAITPYLDPNPTYIPTRDFTVIGGVYRADFLICARANLPQKTLQDLLAYAKANPGKVAYGSVGIASPNHVQHEELARLGGATMLHVPYTGESPIVPALLTGQLDIALLTVNAAEPFIREGKIRVLAVGGPNRTPAFPDVPTAADILGAPDYTANSWTVLIAPRGTPPAIIETLNNALNTALALPEVKERFTKMGLSLMSGTSEEAQAFVSAEVDRYRKLVKLNDIKRE